RLLDPPLHEFLPHTEKDQKELAEALNISVKEIKERNENLHEFNPMLGHRGCRLAITYPEIYRMQVRAIMEAAIEVDNSGVKVIPEIMIPLTTELKEFSLVKEECLEEIQKVF